MSSKTPTYAVVKDLSSSKTDERQLVRVSDLFECVGPKWKPFQPHDVKDFKANEEYGLIRAPNLVLHFIAALYAGSEEEANKFMKSTGRKVVPKRLSTSSPSIPLSDVQFFEEERSQLVKIQSNVVAEKVVARFQELQTISSLVTSQTRKETVKNVDFQSGRTEESLKDKRRSPDDSSFQAAPPKKFKTTEAENAGKKKAQKPKDTRKLEDLKKLEDTKNSEDTTKLENLKKTQKLDKPKSEQCSCACKDEVAAVKECLLQFKEDICAQLEGLQLCAENIPAGTLGLILAANPFQLTSGQKSTQKGKGTTAAEKDFPNVEFIDKHVWIGMDKIMTKSQFDEAEDKISLGMRLSALADIVLPGGLVAHSLSGATAANPHLMKISDEQVGVLVALLRAMNGWLDRSPVDEVTVKKKLRQLTYESRRPVEQSRDKRKKGKRSTEAEEPKGTDKEAGEVLVVTDEVSNDEGEKREDSDSELEERPSEVEKDPLEVDTCADMFASQELARVQSDSDNEGYFEQLAQKMSHH